MKKNYCDNCGEEYNEEEDRRTYRTMQSAKTKSGRMCQYLANTHYIDMCLACRMQLLNVLLEFFGVEESN